MSTPDPNERSDPRRVLDADFGTVRKGGFDPEQVRSFQAAVASELDRLRRELGETQDELERAVNLAEEGRPAAEEDPFERLGRAASEVLRAANGQADEMREQAQEHAARMRLESENLLAEARNQVEAMRHESEAMAREAGTQAERVVAVARHEAEKIRQETEEGRMELGRELDLLIRAAKQLRGALDEVSADGAELDTANDLVELSDSAGPEEIEQRNSGDEVRIDLTEDPELNLRLQSLRDKLSQELKKSQQGPSDPAQ